MKNFIKNYCISFLVGLVGAFVAAIVGEVSINNTFSWLWYTFCGFIFIMYILTPYARKKMKASPNKPSFLFFRDIRFLVVGADLF